MGRDSRWSGAAVFDEAIAASELAAALLCTKGKKAGTSIGGNTVDRLPLSMKVFSLIHTAVRGGLPAAHSTKSVPRRVPSPQSRPIFT